MPRTMTERSVQYVSRVTDVPAVPAQEALELIRGVAGIDLLVVFEVGGSSSIRDEYELAEAVAELNAELESMPVSITVPRPKRRML